MRKIAWVLSFLITCIFITGCGSDKEITTVRIANFPNITHSQALLMSSDEKMNTLQDKNNKSIPVEWKTFNAGPAEVEALLAGEVDMGYIGPGPAINAFVKSKGDVVIIAGATDAGAVLVARKDIKEKDIVKILDGKKVAVPQFGNTQDLCLRNLMEQNGLQDTTKGGTVEVVQAANPDIKTLLEQGEIDAAFVPEPWGARLNIEVGANIILDEKEVWRNGEYTTAVVVVRKEFLENHPDIVENFLQNHIDKTMAMQKDITTNQTLVNKKITDLTKKPLSNDVLEKAFARLDVTYNPRSESVLEMAQMSKNAGFLREVPNNMKDIFQLDLLNKILEKNNLEPVK